MTVARDGAYACREEEGHAEEESVVSLAHEEGGGVKRGGAGEGGVSRVTSESLS